MSTETIATQNEILRGVVGSTAHGTGLDGQEDRDEMGVFIEPAANVCGLNSVDHYIYRTAGEGNRSGPDDAVCALAWSRSPRRSRSSRTPSVACARWSMAARSSPTATASTSFWSRPTSSTG